MGSMPHDIVSFWTRYVIDINCMQIWAVARREEGGAGETDEEESIIAVA